MGEKQGKSLEQVKYLFEHSICKDLMLTVPQNAENAGIDELFLYTSHNGLYEKYGWEFMETVKTFDENSPKERLYKLKIK